MLRLVCLAASLLWVVTTVSCDFSKVRRITHPKAAAETLGSYDLNQAVPAGGLGFTLTFPEDDEFSSSGDGNSPDDYIELQGILLKAACQTPANVASVKKFQAGAEKTLFETRPLLTLELFKVEPILINPTAGATEDYTKCGTSMSANPLCVDRPQEQKKLVEKIVFPVTCPKSQIAISVDKGIPNGTYQLRTQLLNRKHDQVKYFGETLVFSIVDGITDASVALTMQKVKGNIPIEMNVDEEPVEQLNYDDVKMITFTETDRVKKQEVTVTFLKGEHSITIKTNDLEGKMISAKTVGIADFGESIETVMKLIVDEFNANTESPKLRLRPSCPDGWYATFEFSVSVANNDKSKDGGSLSAVNVPLVCHEGMDKSRSEIIKLMGG